MEAKVGEALDTKYPTATATAPSGTSQLMGHGANAVVHRRYIVSFCSSSSVIIETVIVHVIGRRLGQMRWLLRMFLGKDSAVVTVGLIVMVLSPRISMQLLGISWSLVSAADLWPNVLVEAEIVK